ncbi:MAG: hypothetical protein IPK78_00705 [Rhodospirillales bacterium]|nr:hypothetical protein [Rhodospirillales bacterium]
MRAAVLLAVLALPLATFPASAAGQHESSGGTVVVRYPAGNCGISLAKENWLETAKQRGAEVVSEVFRKRGPIP